MGKARESWTLARLRFRAALLIGLIVLGIARPAHAQTIELTRSPALPAFPAPSVAAEIVKVLEKEASELTIEAANVGEGDQLTGLRARIAVRRLAAELLAQGDRAAPAEDGITGSVIALKGLKLAVGRATLDAAIATVTAPDDGVTMMTGARRDAGIAALAAFTQAYADHVTDGPSNGASIDDWTAALLARLLPLVVDEAGRPPASHWVEDHRAAAGTDDLAVALQALRDRAVAAALDDASRASLLATIDFLERGRSFPELQPRVGQCIQTVMELLDCAEAIAAAAWLEEASRAAFAQSLAKAIGQFRDPATRAAGQAAAQNLAAVTRVLAAASVLEADRVDVKTLRNAVAAAQHAADEAGADDDPSRPMTQLAVILERMTAYRALPASGLTKDLRTAERELAKTYRESEQKVLKELSRDGSSAALSDRARSDPAMSSLLADHRQRLEDLQRLRRMPQWSTGIAQVYPPAAKDFDNQLKRWAQALLDPSRRSEAILTMDRFERELADFERMPFEDALREPRVEAIELCAGQHEQVLAIVAEQRRAWADDWSRPEQTPEPSKALATTRLLLETMRDAAALTRLDADMLNRWPMWQVSADLVDRERREVITRLKLASAAMVQRDQAAVNEQLSRVEREAPLARLAGRLAHALGNVLSERTSDAAGLVAQLAYPPPMPPAAHAALLIEQRAALAAVCRCAAEAEHARAANDGPAAEITNAWLREAIERLLAAVP